MKSYSITHRLIITILLLEFLSALAITGAATLYERHTRFHSFEVMLRGRADSLLGAVQDAEDKEDNVMLDGTEVNLPAEDIYYVQDARGRVLGHSTNWTGPDAAMQAAKPGKTLHLSLHGEHYRVLRTDGLRIVDPGDKGGGIPRRVSIFYGAPTGGVWHEIQQAAGFYALTSLLLLAVSGMVIFLALNRGLNPLRELAAQAAGVSVDDWNFMPPPQARRVRELAPLTHALESVLARLEQSFTQQRRFVSDAAHELKTAVAVLKSSLQLLALKQRTLHEYEVGLERCQRDCDRMEEAVTRMLTLARVETRPALASGAPADLGQILRQVTQQFETMAELKRLHLLIDVQHNLLIAGEPDQLHLLCANLLLNALQHTPAGGEIRIRTQQTGDAVSLAIEDSGDGIAPQDLPHVFERFYRGDPSRSRNTGGTGLGLAICQAIATRCRSTIEITSDLGVGTRVTVRFPALQTSSAEVKLTMRN